jgi:hypothetical protein
MNIFKNKRFIAMALTFVLVMALAGLPLPAKERRGSTVEVTMIDGSVAKGELLAVKDDVLLLYDQNDGQGKNIDLQEVFQVKVEKKSKFLAGFAIGYGIGLGTLRLTLSRDSIMPYPFLFILPALPGLLGGLLGSIAGTDEQFSLAGELSRIRHENLEKLKRYGREQDFEKPTDD